MIKINLANSLVNSKTSSEGKSPSASAVSPRDIGVKIFLILFPLIGIYMYEKNDLDTKNADLNALKATKERLAGELAQMGSKDDIVKQLTAQKKDLKERIDVMKQIFGLRAQKIETLTLLQRHITPSCWLKKIGFLERTVKVSGNCTDIQAAQEYVSLLSREKETFKSLADQNIAEDKNAGNYRFEFALELRE